MSAHVTCALAIIFFSGSVLALFLNTGKTSFAIIFFSLVFGGGLVAIAVAISRLKFTVNTTVHADYMEVTTPNPPGRAPAQMAARKH